MRFLIQCDTDGLPMFDWQVELINSIKYQNRVYDGALTSYKEKVWELCIAPEKVEDVCSSVPVGSVEFVHRFFELNDIPVPSPVNVPKALYLYGLNPYIAVKDISVFNQQDVPLCGYSAPVFIKSMEKIKHPLNGVSVDIPAGRWQVTEYLPSGFDAEYRCFIFNGLLLDIKQYEGELFKQACDIQAFARECDREYEKVKPTEYPSAYTLDIGVYNGNLYVIEVHNFYSCGLYGFSKPHLYPQMLSQWYVWWLWSNEIF
jgi:hypothetical protein